MAEHGPSGAARTRSDEPYHSLIDAIPALVAVLDATGKSLYRNRSFYEYSGFTDEQALDWWNEGLVLREDVSAAAPDWRRAAAAGRPTQAEMRVRRSDGAYRWHLVRAVPIASLEQWLLVATDIHDRKVAEVELTAALASKDEAVRQHRAAEEQLTLLVEASSALVGSLELDEMAPRILRISARLIAADAYALWSLADDRREWRMLTSSGLSSEYLASASLISVDDIAPLDDAIIVEDVEQAPLVTNRLRLYRQAGIRSLLVLPLTIDGAVAGTLTFYYMERHHFSAAELRIGTALANLTASAMRLTRLRGEQEQIAADLREANAVKDEFLGMVSHELKTPITTILGMADVLAKHGDRISAADRDASLGDIRENATRLHQLIDNLLLLSRLDVGQQLEVEPILVRYEIHKIVADYQSRERDRRFNVHIDPTISPVSAEATNLRQVLQNLLSNALKYSPPGTPIDVTTERRGPDLVVSVLDRGSGIASDEIESIFDPFYRSARTSRAASGAGVGLTVCRRLVEAHGGRIWAAPREGGGSIFSISLPVDQSDELLEV